MEGDLNEARKMYLRALQVSTEAHLVPIALDSLLGLAQLQAQAGKTEQALELLYYILEHPSSTQLTKERVFQLSTRTEKLLSDTQLNVIKENALSQTFEEIVQKFAQE